MATAKKRANTTKPNKGKPDKPDRGKKRAPSSPEEEPIIITGGSVILEYADSVNNKFEDDGSSPGRRKKLRNKLKGSEKSYLTYVDITDKDDNIVMSIDLNSLGINKKCKVKVYYTQ